MVKKILFIDKKLSENLLLRENQPILNKIASILAHSGDSWYIEIVLFCIWIFSSGMTHTISAFFAGSIVIQALFVIALKFIIKRQRPEGSWGEVYRKTDPHSFPSGHAARMIMLSVIAYGFQLPVLGSIILVWGIGVSFARVALGVHYIIDIIVGWIIGLCLGLLMINFKPFFMDLLPFAF